MPPETFKVIDDLAAQSRDVSIAQHRGRSHGGLGAVAAEAGISRESLYRSLSPKGNPTLKTLLAVLKTVGMRLSVEPEHQAHA